MKLPFLKRVAKLVGACADAGFRESACHVLRGADAGAVMMNEWRRKPELCPGGERRAHCRAHQKFGG